MKQQLQSMINKFLTDVKVFKSKNTYYDELKNLTFFKRFFDIMDPVLINYDLMLSYIEYLRNNFNNSNYTIKKKINSVNRMLEFNKIDKIPVGKMKYQKKSIEIFDIQEIEMIKSACTKFERSKDEYYNLLDITLLNFIIDTGCRITETTELKSLNIDFDNNSCIIDVTKNYRNKTVYFTDHTKKLLLKLLKYNQEEYVFFNFRTGKNITRFYFYDLCRHLEQMTKIKINPHKFRHTFASKMIDVGCPLESVQKLLGHSDIKTTMLYIHLNQLKIKNDYFKYITK